MDRKSLAKSSKKGREKSGKARHESGLQKA